MIPDNAPEKARELLDDADPGPWEVDRNGAWGPAVWSPDKPAVWSPGKPAVWSPDGIVFGPYHDREGMEQWEAGSAANLRLAAAAPTLAAIVAGMRPQYRAEYQLADGTWAISDVEKCDGWTTVYGFARGHAAELARTGAAVRIVRRYVTEQEKVA